MVGEVTQLHPVTTLFINKLNDFVHYTIHYKEGAPFDRAPSFVEEQVHYVIVKELVVLTLYSSVEALDLE